MQRYAIESVFLAGLGLFAGIALGQSSANPLGAGVVSRSIDAIGYQVGGGGSKVDLKGTQLMPEASGEAKVEAKKGLTTIQVETKNLAQPTKFGAEFLTFVLWSISPEGRTSNLGELQVDNSGNAKLDATTQLQVFSLVVTAEPYFSARQPSEIVVLENALRKDTKGKIFVVKDYQLMKRGQYEKLGNPLALAPDLKKVPLEMYEARNAVDIARSRGADKYAPDIFSKAEASLQMSENLLARKADKKEIITSARQTVQFSEDARALAVQRTEEERIAQERAAAAATARSEAEAKAAAQAAEAKRRADLDAQRQAELAQAREQQLKAQAEVAALKAAAEADALKVREQAATAETERVRRDAEVAALKAAAEADAAKAREQAAAAETERVRREAEELRSRLLDQFNRVLETRDTPRGLVVNLGEVLFDTGKFDMRQEAREKLARLSGIVLANPGLNLAVEGHTDNTGAQEFNQKLSEQRAETVRSYLVEQGIPQNSVTAQGYAETMPVAPNDTPAGRQKNRRVEIVVSGEIIGTQIGK
jgi:outer membrane protein OmpA-like peptidoglycan-associated protein